MPRSYSWRAPELIEEAWRRLGPLQIITAIVMAAVCGALVVSAALEVRQSLQARQALVSAGVDVYVVSAGDAGLLPASQCEALQHHGGVVSAGAYFGEVTVLDSAWSPSGITVPVLEVSVGAVRSWWPDTPADTSLYVGQDLAQTTGISDGSTITDARGTASVQAVLSSAVTPAILQAGVVRIVPAIGAATECWIRSLPGVDPESIRDLTTAGFPGTVVITVPFAKADNLSVDPVAILDHGASRHLWIAGVAAILLLSLLVALGSRSELGIYRAMGTSTSEIWFMQLVQVAMTVVLPATLGTVAGLLGASLALDLPLRADAIWYVSAPSLSLMFAVVVLGPAMQGLVASRAVVDTLRSS